MDVFYIRAVEIAVLSEHFNLTPVFILCFSHFSSWRYTISSEFIWHSWKRKSIRTKHKSVIWFHGDNTLSRPANWCLFPTLWQHEMVQLRSLSYDKSDVVLVCFSVADPAMFVNVEKFWVNEIRSYLPRTPFLLVGTHLDVKDQRTSVSRLIIHNNKEFSLKPCESCSIYTTSPKYFKD